MGSKGKELTKDVFTWLHTVGKYSISDRNNITTGELLFEKEVFQFEIRYGEKSLIFHLSYMTTIIFSYDTIFVV